MEQMGKFVIREYGNAIDVFRIVGYDFESTQYIMKSVPTKMDVDVLFGRNDYRPLLKSDEPCSLEEAIEMVKEHIERHHNVLSVLASLESGQSPRWLEISRRANYQEEIKHLYPALQNINITLHYLRGHEDTELYREYKKAFKNIRKRFYFYFGEEGKKAVDNFVAVSGVNTDSLCARRTSLALALIGKRRLLEALEKYDQKPIKINNT